MGEVLLVVGRTVVVHIPGMLLVGVVHMYQVEEGHQGVQEVEHHDQGACRGEHLHS